MGSNNMPSAARTALHGHIQRLNIAREAAAEARRPLDRAHDQLERAQARVRNAEAALAAIDQKEAALVGDSWPPAAPSKAVKQVRFDAEEALAFARRTLSTVECNVDIARLASEEAERTVATVAGEFPQAIVAVLAEEGRAALGRLADARSKAAEAEGVVRSLAQALVERKLFREAEPIIVGVNEMGLPVPVVDARPYHDLAERLHHDADATFPERRQ